MIGVDLIKQRREREQQIEKLQQQQQQQHGRRGSRLGQCRAPCHHNTSLSHALQTLFTLQPRNTCISQIDSCDRHKSRCHVQSARSLMSPEVQTALHAKPLWRQNTFAHKGRYIEALDALMTVSLHT